MSDEPRLAPVPMTTAKRTMNYALQTGRRELTPAQRRRVSKKLGRQGIRPQRESGRPASQTVVPILVGNPQLLQPSQLTWAGKAGRALDKITSRGKAAASKPADSRAAPAGRFRRQGQGGRHA
jgi:hypothetical protein